jgi:hypothetical protein
MTINSYLKKYNRTEERVMNWLVGNGADRAIAYFILDSYANIDKNFDTGTDLDNQVLKDCFDSQAKNITEFLEVHKKMNFKPSLVDRVKSKVKSWTTKQ